MLDPNKLTLSPFIPHGSADAEWQIVDAAGNVVLTIDPMMAAEEPGELAASILKALQACQMLCDAYRYGVGPGDKVEWEHLDAAAARAAEALGVDLNEPLEAAGEDEHTPDHKIGARSTCERCGQEIEWTGTTWWDRGGDVTCGPYAGSDGEIVPEDHTKPHMPGA